MSESTRETLARLAEVRARCDAATRVPKSTAIERAELLDAVKKRAYGPGVDLLRRLLCEIDALDGHRTDLPALLAALEEVVGLVRYVVKEHKSGWQLGLGGCVCHLCRKARALGLLDQTEKKEESK